MTYSESRNRSLLPARIESENTKMRQSKRKVLAKKGWKTGSAKEFLELTDEEFAVIELKLALGNAVKQRRQKQRMTQTAFAKAISSSQSRVAKMEAGDPSVSLDLLVKSMLSLGATRRDVAKAIGN
jgi:DNA-binding XRE family transcriptional regulator